MNIYQQSMDFFSSLPVILEWQEAQDLYQRAASHKPTHWRLPLRACQAVGGNLDLAIPAVTATACAHIGILLVDDMLDADPRGAYHQLGMPGTSDLACAFQAAALSALGYAIQEPAAQQHAMVRFNEMFLSTAFGQFLDVQASSDEDVYWQVAQAKSSPFFGAALQVGTLAGGASLETAEKMYHLGCVYGEMIQIHDDLHDVMETPASPDWVEKRKPLPILFAELVNHPRQARFVELTQRITEPDALLEAQEILIQCGAVSYCMDQTLKRYQAAQAILDDLTLANREPIMSLVESVFTPVRTLLAACQV